MLQLPIYPIAFKIKPIISHEPKAKTKPIIAAYNVFFPKVNNPWFPAEIRINIPPIVSIKTANGVTINFMAKLKMRTSITKKS